MVALINIRLKPLDLDIIHTNAPMSEGHATIIEEFYEQLKDNLKHQKKEEVNVILGDMNGKIARKRLHMWCIFCNEKEK